MKSRLSDLRVALVVFCLTTSAVVIAPTIPPVGAQEATNDGPAEPDHSFVAAPCSGLVATIMGTAGDDVLTGTAGNDVILGLGGNDQIDGRGGNDTIVGGAGNDSIAGGNGNDTLCGGQGDDTILGNAGDDLLFGQAGADRIEGGNGADSLYGGLGPDDIVGGNGTDLISGGADADTLTGSGDADQVFGDAGADTISGRSGDDQLWGGNGRDRINGGTGADQIVGGDGNDRLFGNEDSDTIYGSAGSDRLNGGPGDDELVGGDGEDQALGGDGEDSCESAASEACEVTDEDTEPPTTPVTPVATSNGSDQTLLQWGASLDNVGVMEYIISRDGIEVATTSATYYADSQVVAGSTYSYTVAARDASGNTSTTAGVQLVVGSTDSFCSSAVANDGSLSVGWFDAPSGGSLTVFQMGSDRFVRQEQLERDEFGAFAEGLTVAATTEIRVIQELANGDVGASLACGLETTAGSLDEFVAALPRLPDGRIGAEATSTAPVPVPLSPSLPATPGSARTAESMCASGGLYQPAPPEAGTNGKQYATVHIPAGYSLLYDAYALKDTTSTGNWSSNLSIHTRTEDGGLDGLLERDAYGAPFYWDQPGEVLLAEDRLFFTNGGETREFIVVLDFGSSVNIDSADVGAAHRIDNFRLRGPNGDVQPVCGLEDLSRCQANGGNFFVPEGEIALPGGDPLVAGCYHYDSCVGDGSILQTVGEFACENDALLTGLLAASATVAVIAGVIVVGLAVAPVFAAVTAAAAYGGATVGTAQVFLGIGAALTVTYVYYNQLFNPAAPDIGASTAEVSATAQTVWSQLYPDLDPVLDGPSVTIDPTTGVAVWTGPTVTTRTEEALGERTITIGGQSQTIDEYTNRPDVPEPERQRFRNLIRRAARTCVVGLLPGSALATSAEFIAGLSHPELEGATIGTDGVVAPSPSFPVPRHACEFVKIHVPGSVTTIGRPISQATMHINEVLGTLLPLPAASHPGAQPTLPQPQWAFLNREQKVNNRWYVNAPYRCEGNESTGQAVTNGHGTQRCRAATRRGASSSARSLTCGS